MPSDRPEAASPSRRELLYVSAAATLATTTLAAAAPGNLVEDRVTSIRLTALKAIPAGPKAYVRLETNYKVTGWGEITGLEPQVACALA